VVYIIIIIYAPKSAAEVAGRRRVGSAKQSHTSPMAGDNNNYSHYESIRRDRRRRPSVLRLYF